MKKILVNQLKKYLNFLRKNKKLVSVFFIFLLLPNLLRQVLYYVTFLKTNSTAFIVSFETVKIFSTFPFLGVLEEIILGVVFTLLWFYHKGFRFLGYAWITDALFDYISVIVWFFIGQTPLQLLGINVMWRFLLREVILFYLITGPLLARFKVNITKLIVSYLIIGLTFLFVIIFI